MASSGVGRDKAQFLSSLRDITDTIVCPPDRERYSQAREGRARNSAQRVANPPFIVRPDMRVASQSSLSNIRQLRENMDSALRNGFSTPLDSVEGADFPGREGDADGSSGVSPSREGAVYSSGAGAGAGAELGPRAAPSSHNDTLEPLPNRMGRSLEQILAALDGDELPAQPPAPSVPQAAHKGEARAETRATTAPYKHVSVSASLLDEFPFLKQSKSELAEDVGSDAGVEEDGEGEGEEGGEEEEEEEEEQEELEEDEDSEKDGESKGAVVDMEVQSERGKDALFAGGRATAPEGRKVGESELERASVRTRLQAWEDELSRREAALENRRFLDSAARDRLSRAGSTEPHFHIHNHMGAPPVPATPATARGLPLPRWDESSYWHENPRLETTPSAAPSHLTPSAAADTLRDSIDLSGLSLERLRELTGHH
ncbi:hypothetical protein B484DRAFT_447622 [Ochromonadaceae sp. CCMP2298]|nr:hypothetical protein B484DRAFT_447622 [Ochromonadaceae sp. CCMP2298]